MESGDWKAQMQRERIVNKILDTLKTHLPFSGYERLQELKNIAQRVEQEVYTASASQSEYARKICLNILIMEARLQNAMRSNSAANNVNRSLPLDGGDWQEEIYQKINALKDLYLLDLKNLYLLDLRPTQSSSDAVGDTSMESGDWRVQLQAHSRERIKNRIMDTLTRHLPFSGYDELQEVKKIAERVEEEVYTGVTNLSEYARLLCLIMLTMETRLRNFMSDSMQSNSVANGVNPSYPGSEVMHQVNNQEQQLPIPMPSNNIQQKMSKNIGSAGMHDSSGFSSALPRGTALQQPAMTNVAGQSLNMQNNQNMSSFQQNLLNGKRYNFTAMQLQQLYLQQMLQLQSLITQQNMLSSLHQPQQQLIAQHNNLFSMQQQQYGQQQQFLGNQPGNAIMQTNQHSVQQTLQSNKMPIQQQNQQSSANLLPTQVQQSKTQLQQQVMSHMQSQLGRLQPNPLQSDMQQRLPTASGFPQQNVTDQQKQLFQKQRDMPESSSTSHESTARTGNPTGEDWQEEVYQKIKAMKDMYLPDLNDIHHNFFSKLQQHDSFPLQPRNEQTEKLIVFKYALERYMQFLQTPKHEILSSYKDKLAAYEKHIIYLINANKRKPAAPQQQAQPHSQLTQVQSHENQINLQNSMAQMQLDNIGSVQQDTTGLLSGDSNA